MKGSGKSSSAGRPQGPGDPGGPGSRARRVAADPFDGQPTMRGYCLCGKVEFEIIVPAFWAWHDHSMASRLAHGAAYATYVGSWRKRFRLVKGSEEVRCFDDEEQGATRSFCGCCGSPLFYQRSRTARMIDIPLALFAGPIGREPRYHIAIDECRDWAFSGAALEPLPGYPGVFRERPRSRRKGKPAPPSAG
ncbi:MAG: GFA family protein [Lautropia sp.]